MTLTSTWQPGRHTAYDLARAQSLVRSEDAQRDLVREKSPGRQRFFVGSTWYAVGWRKELFAFDPEAGGWRQLDDGEKKTPKDASTCFAAGDRLMRVDGDGAIFAREGNAWRQLGSGSEEFGRRSGLFYVAHEPAAANGSRAERVVVWNADAVSGPPDDYGRGLKYRANNDTLLFENGRWRKAKPSPKPAEKLSEWFLLAWDSALQRTVRFGSKEVALLEGDRWVAYRPKQYAQLFKLGLLSTLVAHDPKTSVTFLITAPRERDHSISKWQNGRIVRFDVDACAALESFPSPNDGYSLGKDLEQPSYCFDASTRRLWVQATGADSLVFSLDLASAFESVRRPRHLPRGTTAAPKPARALKRTSPKTDPIAVTEAKYGVRLPREYAEFLTSGAHEKKTMQMPDHGSVYFVVGEQVCGRKDVLRGSADKLRDHFLSSAQESGADLSTILLFALLGDEDSLSSSALVIDVAKANKKGECPVLLYEHDDGSFEPLARSIAQFLDKYEDA